MLKKKEWGTLFILTLFIGFSVALHKLGGEEGTEFLLIAFIGVFLALIINILIKKVTAFYLDTEIEFKVWEFKKWGFRAHDKFKKGFPAGIFFPLIFAVLLAPLNGFLWVGSMVFDVKAKKYKTAKRHGYYSFSEATENHIGGIALAGVIANLLLGLIFYLIGIPEIAKINIWFAFFNIIPISDLDGNKIFFGNYIAWAVLAIISIISLVYTFLPY